MMLKFAVLAPLFPPATLGGGPIRTLDALVREAPRSGEVWVFTADHDLYQTAPLPVESNQWTTRGRAEVYYVSDRSVAGLIRGYRRVARRRPDVIYLNSFFEPKYSILPQLLASLLWTRKPVRLLAPRGEFSEGALELKSSKKRIFIAVYRFLRLDRHVIWHASSEMEARDIRRIWPRAEIIVRENETSLPRQASRPTPNSGTPLRMAFLSRIVPKKGLVVALRALKEVRASVRFDVFGSEEDAPYMAECEDIVRSLPENVSVVFHGAVAPENVRAILAPFDLFVFPTAGENFGHVIAESLSASCPVMVTETTPWNSRVLAGGGVLVGTREPMDWAAEIERYAALLPSERFQRRLMAGESFERWRDEEKGPHIFETVASILEGRSHPA